MFDIQASQNRKINKLKEWRSKYSKNEYPYKVVLNMFYELFSIEFIWDDINQAFMGVEQFTDLTKALLHIGERKRQVQISVIHQRLEQLMQNDRVAGGIKFSDFKSMIQNAINGDNHQVIEIEYSYWFYCQYWEAVLEWAAYGLLGMDKHSAFREVTGGDVGGLKLDTFKDAITYFHKVLGISFSYKDVDGNRIDPLLEKNKKYYPDSFEILPPLWDKSTKGSGGKSGCFVATVAFGNYNHPELFFLRSFRDNILNKTKWGRYFIWLYYKIGPIIAELVQKFMLEKIVKSFILSFIIVIKKMNFGENE